MPAPNLPGIILDRAHPLTRGLVGWWPMNEGGGARVNDVTGINPGMTILDPMWIGVGNSLVGHALKFNGSTQYINVPHSASLAIVRDLSCSVWCFPSVSGVYHMLITKTNGNAAASWDWYLQSSDSKPRVFMGNGTIVTGTTGTVAPTIGKWNHIAFTVSGTTVTQYLNGANNGSATNANARGDTGAAVRIGLRNDNFGHFSGPLSQARIYNRALSDAEVGELYANPMAGAYWDDTKGLPIIEGILSSALAGMILAGSAVVPVFAALAKTLVGTTLLGISRVRNRDRSVYRQGGGGAGGRRATQVDHKGNRTVR